MRLHCKTAGLAALLMSTGLALADTAVVRKQVTDGPRAYAATRPVIVTPPVVAAPPAARVNVEDPVIFAGPFMYPRFVIWPDPNFPTEGGSDSR